MSQMWRSFRAVLLPVFCAASLLIVSVAGLAGAVRVVDGEEGFKPLFDGKTLNGWEGNLRYWSVRDGMIVGRHEGIRHNEFLCTEKEFSDFELRLEFQLVGGRGNSGIQFRSKRVPNSTEVSGYQADIGEGYWGALYDESRRNRVLAAPQGDVRAMLEKALNKSGWNTYVIRAVGNRITLTLAGVKTVDYVEKDPNIARSGIIGLQIHGGPPMEIRFRNIRIKELSAE